MQPLRYSINVTLDGCCDHLAVQPDKSVHRHYADALQRADILLFGRVTYTMMEEAWRRPDDGVWPAWMDDADVAFATAIDGARKVVVSSTLDQVDWNAELLQGDLGPAVSALKAESGRGVHTGGLTLPRALADLDLIDEYEFLVHPVVAGHGPTLFAGLDRPLDLELVAREELGGGAVAHRYRPRGRGH